MIEVIPKYVFVIDWQDQIIPLPYNHPNAVTPIDFDFTYGTRIEDFSRMVGLTGAIRVHDPDGDLDPVTKDEGSAEFEMLSVPHRFWMYALDSEPPDTTIRQEGWAVVERRPDKDHARIRLVSKEFIRLRQETTVGQFNTYYIIPPPPPDPRGSQTPVRRPQSDARVNSVQLAGYNETFTQANLTAFWKHADDDPITGPGFQVTNLYIRWDGPSKGSLTVPVTDSPTPFSIPVVPGGTYVIEADVQPDLALPYVTAPFTVPTGDEGDPPTINNLSITESDTSASIVATVTNPPDGSPMVDFVIGDLTRESGIEGGQAFAQFSGLSPSTTYEVTATLRGTNVSRSAMFTTTASGATPDPEEGPVNIPDVEIINDTFSAQILPNSQLRLVGQVTDLNDAGGTLSGLTIFQNYRLATSNTRIPLAGATTDANGQFQSDHTINLPQQNVIYEAQALVEGGSRHATTNFSFSQGSVAQSASLAALSGRATGATTATLTATISNPTSSGSVWYEYKPQGTTQWISAGSSPRPVGQTFVSKNLTGLSPSCLLYTSPSPRDS